MVSEMSSTTQRGAAAAAVVEAWRTRAMLRREVRSSILCAACNLCLQGVQCLLDCCNDARLQCDCNAAYAMVFEPQVAPLRATSRQPSESNASVL